MKQPSSQLYSPCTPILALVRMTFQKIPIEQPARGKGDILSQYNLFNLSQSLQTVCFFRFEA